MEYKDGEIGRAVFTFRESWMNHVRKARDAELSFEISSKAVYVVANCDKRERFSGSSRILPLPNEISNFEERSLINSVVVYRRPLSGGSTVIIISLFGAPLL